MTCYLVMLLKAYSRQVQTEVKIPFPEQLSQDAASLMSSYFLYCPIYTSLTRCPSCLVMISLLLLWQESDYVLRGFLHTHLSAFSSCLCPQLGYNWCPRVTCTFKWELLVIIHIILSINTGRDTGKLISSPSYLLHECWMPFWGFLPA